MIGRYLSLRQSPWKVGDGAPSFYWVQATLSSLDKVIDHFILFLMILTVKNFLSTLFMVLGVCNGGVRLPLMKIELAIATTPLF